MDIILKEITKSFGQNKVLCGVNFHLRTGEIHALMGENGAGKSTMMNILTGLLKADTGSILVDGKEMVFKKQKSMVLLLYIKNSIYGKIYQF